MTSKVDTATKTFQASAALGRNLLVRLSSGKLALAAAASTDVLGSTTREAFAADEYIAVDLLSKQGTIICTASGAVTAGAVVNQDANGKVQAGAGTVKVGIALTAAGADGDFVEVMPVSA